MQSVAVRLICDREREIQAFVPQEYWTLIARLTPFRGLPLRSPPVQIDGEKAEITNGDQAESIVRDLDSAEYRSGHKRAERRRNAPAPFITSTMQQEASRKLGFGASKTIAPQDLYEGLNWVQSSADLITYLRTDSTRVARRRLPNAATISSRPTGRTTCQRRRAAHRKSKTAQDAHEAIRPRSVVRTPESVRQF